MWGKVIDDDDDDDDNDDDDDDDEYTDSHKPWVLLQCLLL